MPSMTETMKRITAAQTAENAEITRLASLLGVELPPLASEYNATRYEQIAAHSERTARALKSIADDYEEQTDPVDDEPIEGETTKPRTTRKPKVARADDEQSG